jgi:hypothetical protein
MKWKGHVAGVGEKCTKVVVEKTEGMKKNSKFYLR